MTQLVPSLLRPLLAVAATLGMVFSIATPADAAARGIAAVCEDPPPADYDDRDEIAGPHRLAVDCLTERGVVHGYGYDEGQRYLPAAEVRRGQMATFVARLLTEAGVELPAPTDQGYEDVDDDHVHADAIRQLSRIEVVHGVGGDRYAPDAPVTRAQMASYLVRAAAHQAGIQADDLQGGDTPFTDVSSGSTHGPSIEGVYELGISEGITADRYAPESAVRRDEMASFVARTLDAMVTRRTLSDQDRGPLAHTTFTFLSEAGRCFQVKAGSAWVTACDPATDDTLQVRNVTVDDGFTVVAGLVTDEVTRVEIEFDDTERIEVDLVATRSPGLRAWASPVLHSQVDAVVAYEGDREVARTSPDDDTERSAFHGTTERSQSEGTGEPVNVTDVRIGHHQTYDRAVFDLSGDGFPGWDVRYVDEARQQGSGQTIDVAGEATLEIMLTGVQYPQGGERPGNGTRVEGVDHLREVYVSNVYEAKSQFFAGVTERTPFRVFTLDDPPRIVVDVAHP